MPSAPSRAQRHGTLFGADELAARIAGLAPEQLRAIREYVAATDPEPPRRCWGWKEIAEEIGVVVSTAKEYGARERDPLPWEYGHRGV